MRVGQLPPRGAKSCGKGSVCVYVRVCVCVYVGFSCSSGVAFKNNFMPDWSRPITPQVA